MSLLLDIPEETGIEPKLDKYFNKDGGPQIQNLKRQIKEQLEVIYKLKDRDSLRECRQKFQEIIQIIYESIEQKLQQYDAKQQNINNKLNAEKQNLQKLLENIELSSESAFYEFKSEYESFFVERKSLRRSFAEEIENFVLDIESKRNEMKEREYWIKSVKEENEKLRKCVEYEFEKLMEITDYFKLEVDLSEKALKEKNERPEFTWWVGRENAETCSLNDDSKCINIYDPLGNMGMTLTLFKGDFSLYNSGYCQKDKYAYITGGKDSKADILSNAYQFNMPTQELIQLASMKIPKFSHTLYASLTTPNIYSLGGETSQLLDIVEIFNSEIGEWKIMGERLPVQGKHFTAASFIRYKEKVCVEDIYIFGGIGGKTQNTFMRGIYRMQISEEGGGWAEVRVVHNEWLGGYGTLCLQINSNDFLIAGGKFGMNDLNVSHDTYIFDTQKLTIINIYSRLKYGSYFLHSTSIIGRNQENIYAMDIRRNLHLFSKKRCKWKMIEAKDWVSIFPERVDYHELNEMTNLFSASNSMHLVNSNKMKIVNTNTNSNI